MPLRLAASEGQRGSARADWNAYATAYDLLSEHNPAYQALLADFEAFLGTIEPPRVILDVGAGTGNYTEIAARKFPDAELYCIEPDAGMIARAEEKLAAHPQIRFENLPLEDVREEGIADLIVCVHAVYAMPGQAERLKDLHRLLRPGGMLYLIDLGRPMDVSDWRGFLFSHLRNERGLWGALKVFWQGREIAKQNNNILKAQQQGVYWTHSEAEIAAAVTAAGFDILRQQSVYRGYSDLLVCRARPVSP